MKIIDAHLHFMAVADFDRIAVAAGHENTEEHLAAAYETYGISTGIVMGNGPLDCQHCHPSFLHYCVGLDIMDWQEDREAGLRLTEENLQRPDCAGLKLYPGYNAFYVYDEMLAPLYALAEKYHKPVAIHTGLTASGMGLLKYSHPLTLDEAASRWPGVQFVMCHLGNPFLQDAVAVLEKNQNVAADLSGLLEGKIPDWEAFTRQKRGYLRMLRDWLEYLDCYDKIMFGTDWPLANLEDYIKLTKEIAPPEAWEAVFHGSAERIYGLTACSRSEGKNHEFGNGGVENPCTGKG